MKIGRIVLATCFATCVGCGGGGDDSTPSTNACGSLGLKEATTGKIVDGSICSNLSSSPVVRVIVVEADASSEEALCTGTMLSPRLVLTAAHCVVDTAGAGIAYGDVPNVTVVRAAKAYFSNGYSVGPGYLIDDVAILVLESDVSLPTLPIHVSSAPQVGDVAQIFGYGQDTPATADAVNLRSGEVQIASLNSDIIESGFNGTGSKTCHGDSGGPLLESFSGDEAIIGITSTGSSAGCQEGVESFFTNMQSPSVLGFLANFPDIVYN